MVKRYFLKNRQPVILDPLKETKAVGVLALARAGSRYEQLKFLGLSHFLEHLLFKGTKKRPSSLVLAKELDRYGALYNAYTAKDHTGYWIKIAGEHLEFALELLSDMLFNSRFLADEITREKGVIIEEINMYRDNPMLYIESLAEELVFQGHPLGWLIAGSPESVRAVSRKEVVDYHCRRYFPGNMLLSIAGRIDPEEALKLAEKYFSRPRKQYSKPKVKNFLISQKKPRAVLMKKETKQVQLALAFPGPGYRQTRKILAAELLSAILGGSMSSRLFIKIRERQGLCYYIHSEFNPYAEAGSFLVQAGLDKQRIFPAIDLISRELRRIKNKKVGRAELTKAKEMLRGKIILALEDSSTVAQWHGRRLFLAGRLGSPEEKIKELETVSAEEIKNLAEEIFQPARANLAIIGPFNEKEKFLKSLKI